MDWVEKGLLGIVAILVAALVVLMVDLMIPDKLQCNNWQVIIWDEHNSDVYLREIDGHHVQKLYMDFNKIPQDLGVGDKVLLCEERSRIYRMREDWSLKRLGQ